MPSNTSSEVMKSQTVLARNFFSHNNCGKIRLQKMSSQYVGAYGPVMRFQMANISNGLALYQAMKASKTYEYATISPVASMTLAMLSRWRMVIRSCNPYMARSGMAKTSTMAKPE